MALENNFALMCPNNWTGVALIMDTIHAILIYSSSALCAYAFLNSASLQVHQEQVATLLLLRAFFPIFMKPSGDH